MRGRALVMAVCGVLAGTAAPALAQAECAAGRQALGVSRTIEIETDTAPRFGAKYRQSDLLADREVVLTFDDGPHRAYTRIVLDALAAHCAKAIFFMVGRMAASDPDMVREVARQGHTVGVHTWSHAKLSRVGSQQATNEIELGFSAVQQALGEPVAPFFRFPYLADSEATAAYLRKRQMATFDIDVDSKDYRTHDPRHVQHRVMAELEKKGRGIILFHDIQPSTVRALPPLLAELKAKGFRVVHLKPKGPATTLAQYDTMAQQQLDQRRAQVQSQPLVRRSVVWPSAGATPAPARAAEVKPVVARPAPQPAAAASDSNPFAKLFRWW